MINQGVQNLLQAPEIDWVSWQKLCLLNYWHLFSFIFFLFFFSPFLFFCMSVCAAVSPSSPGHTRSRKVTDLVLGQLPSPPRSAARRKPRERAGTILQLRDDAFAALTRMGTRLFLPEQITLPFPPQNLPLEVWRLFSTLLHGIFIALYVGRPVISRVACMQSQGLLLTHITKPVWALLWDPGVGEKPKCHIAVKLLLMLLVCHITWCCISSSQHPC